MRMAGLIVLAAALAPTGCGEAETPRETVGPGEGLGQAFYQLGERSGLCSASDNRAAFVVYGDEDTNCMAQGSIEVDANGGMALAPRGDADCRIPIEDLGQSIRLGDGGEACTYYCGGTAVYAGRELTKNWDETPDLRDAAGEPIC